MSAQFAIRPVTTERNSFGMYEYEISSDARVVARYWHDFRGDEHGITFCDGRRQARPVGQLSEFITGGGPEAIGLSDAAICWLTEQAPE